MQAFLKTGKLGAEASFSPKPGKSGEKKKIPKPWVEKYRPKNIEEVVYQDEVVAVLRKTLDGADLPNLLFYGPPGTGKTSTILAAARELYGDIYKDRVLELNASDERGIQVIREKVKNFAKTSVSSFKANGKPCPPYKIIILDEADSMTTAAQSALRRTMEKQSKTTRFCLLCNYVSRIIDPITSRCSKFRFKPLPKKALMKHLGNICETEGVICEDFALKRLISGSGGDLRRAITCLQSVSRLRMNDTVTKEDVDEVIGVVPKKYLTEFMEVCGTNSYDKISEFINEMMFEAYSATQLINQIHDRIIDDVSLDSDKKGRILENLAHCEFRLCDGADEYLQLMDLAVVIMTELCRTSSCIKFP